MKIFIFIFFSLLVVANDTTAQDELSCSVRGTRVHYINGMFNSDEDASKSHGLLNIIYRSEKTKNEIDSKGKVIISYTYQKSFASMNNNLFGYVIGGIADVTEVLGNYLKDRAEFSKTDEATIWKALPGYFFRATKFTHPQFTAAQKTIETIARMGEDELSGLVF